MPVTECRVRAFLDKRGIHYESVHHRLDFTAMEAAEDTHTPGKEFAKAVVLWIDGAFALAVLPAQHHVHLEKVRKALEAKTVRMATEEEMRRLFPDCDLGAEPPFGNLYHLPVYLSTAMVGDEHITFNAGTHEEAIRMRFADWENLVKPRILDLSPRE